MHTCTDKHKQTNTHTLRKTERGRRGELKLQLRSRGGRESGRSNRRKEGKKGERERGQSDERLQKDNGARYEGKTGRDGKERRWKKRRGRQKRMLVEEIGREIKLSLMGGEGVLKGGGGGREQEQREGQV